MSWQLAPHHESLIPGVRALNERLRAGNLEDEYLFDERQVTTGTRMPQMPRTQLLLLEGEHVRGGVLLQEQSFWLANETCNVANLQTPVSEGIVNKRYAQAAGVMMSKLQKAQPYLFAVGMGNKTRPLPRLLSAMKWRIEEVPFFFCVTNANAFLRNLGPLRSRRGRRCVATLAASTGAGWCALQAARVWKHRSISKLESVQIESWDSWADDVWNASTKSYSFIARRKAEDLPAFLPIGQRDQVAWRFEEKGKVVGWAAAMVHRVPNSTYFGNMMVGTLLDCLCVPGFERRVVASTSELMNRLGADMLLSNQTHWAWQQAFRACGFFSGPSNYLLGTSPVLSKTVDFRTAHLTRADGDGRIHL